ncbi:glycosyltransferase family 39 protein [Spirillospora sp. NPDC048819]|uniref:glycosyltransferase family 39 protein n=1 Tax=Spirillospora sp. NPDC048819 TaxID=3155268 RepID=UPI0033E8531B
MAGESPQGTALGTAPGTALDGPASRGDTSGGDAGGGGDAGAGDGSAEVTPALRPGVADTAARRDTPGGTTTAGKSADGIKDGPKSAIRPDPQSGPVRTADTGDGPGPGGDTPDESADSGRRRRARGLWTLARRHPAFSVIIAIAALLRVVAMLGYQPVMFFNDSFDYLHVATDPYPHPLRPDGYAFLLLLLKPFHSFALVAAVQHLMGLAMGVMIYALLRRKFRLPGWGAALAAAPVLLDAYQLQLEHLVLSDTMFMFLVMSAVTLLLWHDRPSWRIAAAVGLIVGLSWLTRSVGMPVLLGVLVFMLIRRSGWKMMGVTLAACMLPVLSYMGWYKLDSDKFAITESNGIFLYARVYKFADCHRMDDLPVREYPLCTEPANRLPNSQDGIWNAQSPLNRYTGTRFGPENNALGNDFAKRAIIAQPADYLQVVAYDFFRVFRWERTVFPDPDTYRQYEFRTTTSRTLPDWKMDGNSIASAEAKAYENGDAETRVVEPFAGVARGYQDVFYLRGTMVGGILLIGLAGLVPLWRRFGGPALLPWTLATGLLLAPAATAEFDYRYILPAVPLAALAAGMAFAPEVRGTVAGWGRRLRRGAGSGTAAAPDAPEVPAEPAEPKIPEVAAK